MSPLTRPTLIIRYSSERTKYIAGLPKGEMNIDGKYQTEFATLLEQMDLIVLLLLRNMGISKMTDKEFIDEIIAIVTSTNAAYTEDRAEGFDDIRFIVKQYILSRGMRNGLH